MPLGRKEAGMIIGEALGAWFGDAAAQAKTVSGLEEFGRRYRTIPVLVELEREVEAAEAGGGQAILALARSFLGRDDLIEACLEPLAGAALADPFFRPPLRRAAGEVHAGLLLFDRPSLSIQLAAIGVDALAAKRHFREGRASISFTGQRTLFRFLRAGGASLSFWEAPFIGDGFTADAARRCRLVDRRRLADGDTIELDGRRQSFVIDHAVSDLVYLQAVTPFGAGPLVAEYDSETLTLVGASSTDELSSRIQLMLALLRAMDRRDAAPVFREMLGSRHFYARWQAMREFLALDAELALPHLREMAATDSHPEVRAAAAATLAAFFAADIATAEEPEKCLA
jgi:hypothetical protein